MILEELSQNAMELNPDKCQHMAFSSHSLISNYSYLEQHADFY
jgi:hypothetical protein